MTKTVLDTAKLLEAIAGPDGLDDRQPPYLPPGTLNYSTSLSTWLNSTSTSAPLHGTKIGVLQQGFTLPNMCPTVAAKCRSAISKLASLGAEVTEISIPSHTNASIVWMCSLPIAGGRQGLLSDMSGRKQLYLTDRVLKTGRALSQDAFAALGPGAQNLYMRHLYLDQKYGPELHAKCTNLLRKCNVNKHPPPIPNTTKHILTNECRTTTTAPSNQ